MEKLKVTLKESKTGLIPADQVAIELGISRVSLWRLERSGDLVPALRLGRKVFYSIEQFKV